MHVLVFGPANPPFVNAELEATADKPRPMSVVFSMLLSANLCVLLKNSASTTTDSTDPYAVRMCEVAPLACSLFLFKSLKAGYTYASCYRSFQNSVFHRSRDKSCDRARNPSSPRPPLNREVNYPSLPHHKAERGLCARSQDSAHSNYQIGAAFFL